MHPEWDNSMSELLVDNLTQYVFTVCFKSEVWKVENTWVKVEQYALVWLEPIPQEEKSRVPCTSVGSVEAQFMTANTFSYKKKCIPA